MLNQYLKESENGKYITVQHPDLPAFNMIKVEDGSFIMGDDNSKNEREKPAHNVELSTFYMAEFPVTQELYDAVFAKNVKNQQLYKELRVNPSRFKGKRRPVESINWYESVLFCQKINDILELPQPISGTKDNEILDLKTSGFRLPTEAEWEYAAGGSNYENKNNNNSQPAKTQFSGSDNLDEVGFYRDNNDYETRPVGLKLPNELGLFDMSGNVWEWCWDWYDSEFYKNSKNPNPVNIKKGNYRVLRGGSWLSGAIGSRIAIRDGSTPADRWNSRGFRLVFSLQFTK